jgi:hypothetical protein
VTGSCERSLGKSSRIRIGKSLAGDYVNASFDDAKTVFRRTPTGIRGDLLRALAALLYASGLRRPRQSARVQRMSAKERIIVALVSALAIAMGGAAILHMSGSSSDEGSPSAVNAPPATESADS